MKLSAPSGLYSNLPLVADADVADAGDAGDVADAVGAAADAADAAGEAVACLGVVAAPGADPSINSIMTDDCGRVGLVRSGLLASLQPIRTLRVTGSAVVWAANLEQIRIANSREITLLAEACAFYWHRMEGVLTS